METHALPRAAVDGFSNAVAYEAYRPSYPQDSLSALLNDLGISGKGGANIVEIAAGTGKFTDLLVAREEDFGVRAIEPLKSMRDVLERKGHSRVAVLDGVAAKMPVEDGWGDACIAAQVSQLQA
jgi:ubiquinone/menaquinone biosynthesis C-methylase UbiE